MNNVMLRAIDCLEILNTRPRPMCRDCADEDGTCPTSGLECDMRKLIADARAALATSAAPDGSDPIGDMQAEARQAKLDDFVRAAPERSGKLADVTYKEVGSFLYVGIEYVATSSDDPRGVKLYRAELADSAERSGRLADDDTVIAKLSEIHAKLREAYRLGAQEQGQDAKEYAAAHKLMHEWDLPDAPEADSSSAAPSDDSMPVDMSQAKRLITQLRGRVAELLAAPSPTGESLDIEQCFALAKKQAATLTRIVEVCRPPESFDIAVGAMYEAHTLAVKLRAALATPRQTEDGSGLVDDALGAEKLPEYARTRQGMKCYSLGYTRGRKKGRKDAASGSSAAAEGDNSAMPAQFGDWFKANYPADTLIHDPEWHAPKIYWRAIATSKAVPAGDSHGE